MREVRSLHMHVGTGMKKCVDLTGDEEHTVTKYQCMNYLASVRIHLQTLHLY